MARLSRRALLAAGAAAPLPACVGPLPALDAGALPRSEASLVLRAAELHTEIGVTLAALGEEKRAIVAARLGRPQRVAFGYGQRDYMAAPDPGVGHALRALATSPGVVAMSVLPPFAGEDADTVALGVEAAGIAALLRFVEGQVPRDAQGKLRPIGDGLHRGRVLFDSALPYSAAFTCNTWTAEALKAAGLPFASGGVVWPGQVMAQARRIARLQRQA